MGEHKRQSTTMGFRTAAIITTTCFLLGVLVTGLACADWPILYAGLTGPAYLDKAETYYMTLFNAPGAVPALLHAMIGVCLIALSSKVARWEETNLFFDGSSLALMISAVAMYASVTLPNLRAVARQPLADQSAGIGGKVRMWLGQPMPSAVEAAAIPEPLTGQLRYEVISLLCASNNLIIAALVGVLLFQGAQAWAHSKFEKEMKRIADDAKKAEKSQ